MSDRAAFEVLSYDDPGERQRWQAACEKFGDIDIYYYPEYAYLFQLKGDGKAHCFLYYQSDNELVIYPFLKRPVNELPLFGDLPDQLFDITSPYGYGGYLRSSERVDMNKFYRIFRQYCQDNNVVSEFIRFHPILKNHLYCPNGVITEKWNDTVVIDLTNDKQYLWKQLTSSCRRAIRKAHNCELSIMNDIDFAHIDIFNRIYKNTMEKVGATDYYYFPDSWFYDLFNLFKGKIALFHATYQDSIISSKIFLYDKNYIHYFLGGSISAVQKVRPNNLLLYEVALWSRSQGMKKFHLGGGYRPNDELFRFKASFSPVHMPFFICKIIHDGEYYQSLSQRIQGLGTGHAANEQFFPIYRIPDRTLTG